ncbi:RNA-binding motif protein x-linked [Anaeramoeba flamelloides]|uniref:RNA-binding motif protein x-linked n=1 Tax=Anaeramoeba flamelloides TaxID=1746091 RepID=A0AAV8A8Z7_9EUKA|nr:RNA-binding motif protein x-linked [Anaeramoeba flamelloides]
MNVVRSIHELNEQELEMGLVGEASWHEDFKTSPYIFIGGLDERLTEGDIITVFSQYGTVIDTHLVKDKKTGKSKGYAFLAYEDQRSTILAVDNLNNAELLKRKLRVDHSKDYRPNPLLFEIIDDMEKEKDFYNKIQIVRGNKPTKSKSKSKSEKLKKSTRTSKRSKKKHQKKNKKEKEKEKKNKRESKKKNKNKRKESKNETTVDFQNNYIKKERERKRKQYHENKDNPNTKKPIYKQRRKNEKETKSKKKDKKREKHKSKKKKEKKPKEKVNYFSSSFGFTKKV